MRPKDGQDMAIIINHAQSRLGDLLAEIDKSKSLLKGPESGSQRGTAEKSLPKGITKKTSHKAQTISKNKKKVTSVIQKAIKSGKIPM